MCNKGFTLHFTGRHFTVKSVMRAEEGPALRFPIARLFSQGCALLSPSRNQGYFKVLTFRCVLFSALEVNLRLRVCLYTVSLNCTWTKYMALMDF